MGGNSSKEEKFFKTKKGIKVKKMDEPNPSDPPVEVIEDEPEYFGEDSAKKPTDDTSKKNSARHLNMDLKKNNERQNIERLQAPKILSPKQHSIPKPNFLNQNQSLFENTNNIKTLPNSLNFTNPSMQNVVVMPTRLPPLEFQKGQPFVSVQPVQPALPYMPIQSIQRTQQVVISPRRF